MGLSQLMSGTSRVMQASPLKLLIEHKKGARVRTIRSVLIPDGEDELALRVLRCLAQTRDLKVAVLSRLARAPIRYSRHHHGFYTHRVDDFDHQRIQVIKRAAEQVHADIIFPVGLPGIRLVAEFQQELASVAHLPPLVPPEVLDTFADKLRFTQILEQIGIPHPRFLRPVRAPVDEKQIHGIRFPALVKPRNREGGNGIRLCHTPREVVTYLHRLDNPLDYFIQEFITGADLTCSVLTQHGEILAHTIQRVIVPSHKPFGPSAAVEFIHHQDVLESIAKLIRSVNWSGIVSFDLVWDYKAQQAKVLEANPRYWRSLLGSLTAGVNFPHLACLASQDEPLGHPEYRHVRYAKPEIAARLLLSSWTGHSSAISTVYESGLPYLLKDPRPELAILLSRISTWGLVSHVRIAT